MWGLQLTRRHAKISHRFTPTYVGTSKSSGQSAPQASVHPHVCGDFRGQGRRRTTSGGSPPRMWGLRRVGNRGKSVTRFTPTYVGTSTCTLGPSPYPAVHPHVCGDFSPNNPPRRKGRGSPPRMWGLRSPRRAWRPRRRFTPTYVGTSTERNEGGVAIVGSPPRMWGLHPDRSVQGQVRRFTPTYVGTSPEPIRLRPPPQVHPHVCGDFRVHAVVRWHHGGSPPRMWGLLKPGPAPPPSTRFTPTYVGTSSSDISKAIAVQVHPHVCGDFRSAATTGRARSGSPPRMWGLQTCRAKAIATMRFTPTYVGTSKSPPSEPFVM